MSKLKRYKFWSILFQNKNHPTQSEEWSFPFLFCGTQVTRVRIDGGVVKSFISTGTGIFVHFWRGVPPPSEVYKSPRVRVPPYLDRNFGPSKITVVDHYFGLSKITIVDRNFGPLFIYLFIFWYRPNEQHISVNFDQCPIGRVKKK